MVVGSGVVWCGVVVWLGVRKAVTPGTGVIRHPLAVRQKKVRASAYTQTSKSTIEMNTVGCSLHMFKGAKSSNVCRRTYAISMSHKSLMLPAYLLRRE